MMATGWEKETLNRVKDFVNFTSNYHEMLVNTVNVNVKSILTLVCRERVGIAHRPDA